MAEIRVSGTGVASSAPDEALFHFNCQGFAADASDALASATAAAQAVIDLLDQMGVAASQRGVQRARVHPRIRYHDNREEREGWDATMSVECTLDDVDIAFGLLDATTQVAHVSVDGPNWQIRSDNPAHATARQRAVDDAKVKAKSYSDAADLQLGELMELIEGGADRGVRIRSAMLESSVASLDPSEQSVSALVTLVYLAT